jgi:hypothetical protein
MFRTHKNSLPRPGNKRRRRRSVTTAGNLERNSLRLTTCKRAKTTDYSLPAASSSKPRQQLSQLAWGIMEPTPPIIRCFVTSLAHFFNRTCKPPVVLSEFHSDEKRIFPVSHFRLRTLKFRCSELNTCQQLYCIYNNIIKTTNFYMFRSLLVHHQGVQ